MKVAHYRIADSIDGLTDWRGNTCEPHPKLKWELARGRMFQANLFSNQRRPAL
jgi:hypothetical protein